ncbi:hypothetical protein [Pseudomonas sp. DP-17]|uniref:hypothetical protein n=1 Tax=Pseudomonas sp. DP-17 TaxID=1580486 RepID=UPI001EFA608E|nr:hypothetical protein [Pseudomonas sp. DP-17]MCG8906188.1 hypothetical protein [Pseudomonas sp. DP-17]
MKLQCRINNIKNVPDADSRERIGRYIYLSDSELDLIVGEEYVVYGVAFWDGCPWVYICPEDYDEYPKPYPIELFAVIDNRLSACWRLSYFPGSNKGTMNTMLVFEEWSMYSGFYEGLVDGDAICVEIFERYRRLMDFE